jgi:heptosyltransferase-2
MLLSVPVPRGDETLKTHRVYYYFNLLRGLAPTPPIPRPKLKVPREATAWAERILARLGVDGRPLVAVHPGASAESKRWGPSGYVQLGRRLAREYEAFLAVLGGPSEAELTEEVARGIGASRAADLGGKTSIPELMALLERSSLVVGNDTGPVRLADALNRPVVAIFGSSDPVATRPLGPRHALIRRDLDCSPCLKRRCPLKHHECMKSIAADEVYDACRRVLQQTRG